MYSPHVRACALWKTRAKSSTAVWVVNDDIMGKKAWPPPPPLQTGGCTTPWLCQGPRGEGGSFLPGQPIWEDAGRGAGWAAGAGEGRRLAIPRLLLRAHRPRRRAREAAAQRHQVSPPSRVVLRAESLAVEQDPLGGRLLLAGEVQVSFSPFSFLRVPSSVRSRFKAGGTEPSPIHLHSFSLLLL
jgi:hypothetical protein